VAGVALSHLRLGADPARIAPEPSPASADCAPPWVAAGTPEPLRSQLTAALGSDRVLTRALDLVRYASDASPYRSIPRAIAMPRDIPDVVRLLAFARANRTPLVFRAGGTSLNGQAGTDSVLVDVRRHWQRAWVEQGGLSVRTQPGMVVGHVNRLLARYGRKLGPDPASSDIACVGGVIANNSGGMRCGVHADSYRTVRSLTFVLANGAVIDTATPGAARRFETVAPELAGGLAQLRDELRADPVLTERVRRKFEIKNTTGYRLCALLDADEPLEIFRRLVIGSEGTLAFVAEAVFESVPFGRHATAAMVIFEGVEPAIAAVGPLSAAGADAIEIMVAPTLIAAAYNMPGTPERWKELPPDSAALLVEFRSDDEADLDAPERAALELLEGRALIDPARFTRDPPEIAMFWHVREGMLGLIAAIRPPGAQLIIEDVCFPPDRLSPATHDLTALLGKHGFLPGVAGHARDGNLHFMLMPNFGEASELDRYDAFMQELVELVVGEYDGSLKAEHGTGVNMAPFVEREWGSKATEMMWRIKQLADPDGILAPGTVLNRDPRSHLKNLKSTPEIDEVATKCIECGFCEPVCPSRNVTTTPRQRIAIRREMARQPDGSAVQRALLQQYQYDAIQTCAADGSCKLACPVAIDTGELIKGFRLQQHGVYSQRAGAVAADGYGLAERGARLGVAAGGPVVRTLRTAALPGPAPPQLPSTTQGRAAAVYLPACINRIFGNPNGLAARPTVPEALVAISARAGLPVWIPDDVVGVCCGTPWSSKGFSDGHEVMARRTTEALSRWTGDGELPVVIDATSCTHGLISDVEPEGIQILDSISWVHDHLLERLTVTRKLPTVAVHPTCACMHLGLAGKLTAIAAALSDEVVVPAATGCCGMAGDRGLLHPELPASALRDVARELAGKSFDAYLSSNRTCEIALQQVTERPYESFLLALEELTR
jgi:D-lactate dehydrogenase